MNDESEKKPIVEFKDVTFVYQPVEHLALKNINLTIHEGEFVALIGQNGSGKTTLIKHMNGLLKATKGVVLLEGKKIDKSHRVSQISRKIGYVFQNPANQLFAKSVEDEVAFGPRNLGFDEEKTDQLVEQALQSLQLESVRDLMPFMLGRGEMQRLAIASILSMNPVTLIIDEPTTGLDWHECCNVLNLVKRLNEEGHTIIMTTHNMSLVALYAKRVVVMREGEIVLDGGVDEVFQQTETLKTAQIKPPQHYELMSHFPEIALKKYDLDTVAAAIAKLCPAQKGGSCCECTRHDGNCER